ncbi:MAG: hypothetical protein ACHQ49_15325 [Elusimicrobiota bacterium]
MRVPSCTLAALIILLSVPSWPADWSVERILNAREPEAAAAFLSDDPGQKALAARDEDLYHQVFLSAIDLKSVAELVRGASSETVLRDGLRARPLCEFCQNAPELEAWAAKRLKGIDHDSLRALSLAMYDWETLPADLSRRLSSEGRGPGNWASLTLPERSDTVQPWLTERYVALMAAVPRTSDELKTHNIEVVDVYYMIDREHRNRLNNYQGALETSVEGLEALRLRVAAASDPGLRDALDKAAAAENLESRLELLGKIFDGTGSHDPTTTVAAPPRQDQTFDNSSRHAVAVLLRAGFRRVIAGTWAGDELNAFYASHTLNLHVAPNDGANTIGSYNHDDGVMSFNEDYIVKFLKSKNRSVRDLQTNPALLEELIVDESAVFVHEGVHQEQEVWRRAHDIPQIPDQDMEIEAKQVQALFTIQKSLQDPIYRACLEADARTDGPARSAAEDANSLRDLRPSAFRDQTRREFYPDLPSLEGGVREEMKKAAEGLRRIQDELERRAALPPDQAARLENAPADPAAFPDDGPILRRLGTPGLRGGEMYLRSSVAVVPSAYGAYRERERRVDETTESRLAQLLGGSTLRPVEVPPPAR